MRHQTRWISCLIACVSLALASGCSRFDKNWKEAGQQDFPESGLAGRWMGTWTSEADGHSGELKCLVTDLNGGDEWLFGGHILASNGAVHDELLGLVGHAAQ